VVWEFDSLAKKLLLTLAANPPTRWQKNKETEGRSRVVLDNARDFTDAALVKKKKIINAFCSPHYVLDF